MIAEKMEAGARAAFDQAHRDSEEAYNAEFIRHGQSLSRMMTRRDRMFITTNILKELHPRFVNEPDARHHVWLQLIKRAAYVALTSCAKSTV